MNYLEKFDSLIMECARPLYNSLKEGIVEKTIKEVGTFAGRKINSEFSDLASELTITALKVLPYTLTMFVAMSSLSLNASLVLGAAAAVAFATKLNPFYHDAKVELLAGALSATLIHTAVKVMFAVYALDAGSALLAAVIGGCASTALYAAYRCVKEDPEKDEISNQREDYQNEHEDYQNEHEDYQNEHEDYQNEHEGEYTVLDNGQGEILNDNYQVFPTENLNL